MIWLIGGPARCGKSTLARQARAHSQGQVISLDSLKKAILPVASPADRQELLLTIDDTRHTIKQWLDLLRRRDRIIWKAAKAFIEAAVETGDDVIIEGNLWPDFISELPAGLNCRTVFLIDTSPRHADSLIKIARSPATDNNWMTDWSEDHLQNWATYNIARGRLIKRLAREHHQPVFDIADAGIAQAQADALAYLLA